MVNIIPMEIYFPMLALFLVVPLIAYLMRTEIYSTAVFFICGALIILITMNIDGIAYANLPTNATESGSTTIYQFEQESYMIRNTQSLEPTTLGLGFIFIGVMVVLIGVLMEVKK